MSTRLIIVLLLSPLIFCLSAKDDKSTRNTPEEWIESQAALFAEEMDGIRIYTVNAFDEDGDARIEGFETVESLDGTKGMVGGLLYVVDNMDCDTDNIENVDFDKKQFYLNRVVPVGSGRSAGVCRYTTRYIFDDEIISFVCSDIMFEYKEKGIIPKKTRVDKLKPTTNPSHREFLEGFYKDNSTFINNIKNNAPSLGQAEISHWDEIKKGTVVKGMNHEETKLVGGQPRSVSKSGNREQWIFSNDFIVVFRDGVVANVMQ